MADISIGVVGLPGKWSTEKLADAVEGRTGKRLVVDMAEVPLYALLLGGLLAGWTWRGIVCSTGDMTWPSWMC